MEQGGRVLIVEDDSQVRRLLKHVMDRLGYDCDAAASAAEALALSADGRHAVVLMDVGLPDATGPELTRALLSRGMERPPAVLGFTSDDAATTSEECFAAGMKAVFIKPTQVFALAEAVRRYMAPV